MHGKHAYNSENDDDIKLLKIWEDKSKNSKQYEYAIKYWTIKDPLKRQTAKDNNINLYICGKIYEGGILYLKLII